VGAPLSGDNVKETVRWDIHCDESSQTAHHYIVIGALYGRADRSNQVVRAIEEAIAPHGGTTELKWSSIRRHNVRMYKAAINATYLLMKSGTVSFHCLVVDSKKSNHKEYNEGDAELGFTRYTFTLLFKFARIHAKTTTSPHFYVHLDQRTTPYDPDVTRITLNYKDRAEHGRDYEAYKLVHFVDSKKSRLVQMADVFSGAIAASWNKKHTASHKQEMIDFIQRRWLLSSLDQPTRRQRGPRGIDIWLLDWDARARKAAPQT
jgi:hypothetical protein